MSLTGADLRSIVARSSTLRERAAGPFTAVVNGHGTLVASRLERLTQRVAGGDPSRFERYLRSHDWSHASIARALGPVTFHGDGLPAWAELLGGIGTPPSIDAVTSAAPSGAEPLAPFEDALTPFVDAARARLRERAPAPDAFTSLAWPAFERALHRQLARLAARTFYAEFGAFKLRAAPHHADAGGYRAFAREARAVIDDSPRTDYEAFIRSLRGDGLDRVLQAYPVLGRLLATRVLDWVDSTSELLTRVVADAPLLAKAFGGGRHPGRIAAVVPDLSDPHRCGRTVCRVSFACGLDVIYKPRSLALETAFSSLLEWLNDGRVTLPLMAPAVLDRGTHGWMACVVAAPCVDLAAVQRYYRRAGMLLCLAYVLGGSDLHQGNLIACGEHPVLIDLEALMGAPVRPDEAAGGEHDTDGQQVWDSVLRTGLLPVNRLGLRGRPQRNGGLAPFDPAGGRSVTHWTRMNTDLMAMDLRPLAPHHGNLPQLAGAPATAEPHIEAVIDGFAEMSRVLQRSRAYLLSPSSVLQAFHGVPTRVVLRDTAAYATLLEQALHPRFLRDGAAWSVEFELLTASTTAHTTRPRAWNTWLAEQQALTRLDVPLFTARSDRTSLEAGTVDPIDEADGAVLVNGYLDEPGFAATRTALATLDPHGTRVHQHCIRLALRPSPERSVPDHAVPHGSPHSPRLAEAMAIAKTLASIADNSTQDSPQWIALRGLGRSAQRGLQHLGWDLYGGRCGVGLLFAALESRGVRMGEGDRDGAFAMRVLAPMIAGLNAGAPLAIPADPPHTGPVLGALGAGGIVYGLTAAARLLRSEAALDAATRAAEAITPDAIAADDHLDLMSGVAGAALGLLALCDERPRPRLLDAAVRCGHHLLQSAHRDEQPARLTWRTLDGRVVDGFAHGAAGIAYALARLYRATGTTAFRDAARAGIPVDQSPTARTEAMRRSWCQGAAGIGLSRLDVSRLIDAPELVDGLDVLLRDVSPEETGLSRSDQPCCGNVGRIELLTRADDVLGGTRWRDAAQESAAQVIARAVQRGSYALSAVNDVFCPGFYQGLSGIGYQWLRLEHRDLPSVMLWE